MDRKDHENSKDNVKLQAGFSLTTLQAINQFLAFLGRGAFLICLHLVACACASQNFIYYASTKFISMGKICVFFLGMELSL